MKYLAVFMLIGLVSALDGACVFKKMKSNNSFAEEGIMKSLSITEVFIIHLFTWPVFVLFDIIYLSRSK